MGTAGRSSLWDELVRIGTIRRFRTGEFLVRRGTHPAGLIAIRAGMCKVVDADSDGHEVIVAVRGPGDVIGEIGAVTGDGPVASVLAMQPVEAAMVGLDDFHAHLDSSLHASRSVVAMVAHRAAEWNRAAMVAHRRVEARLADRILLLADHFGEDRDGVIAVHSPLTHDDYASWVGATRAVATRALGALREQGLIDFGRGWVAVIDAEGLRQLCRLDP